MNSEQFNFGVSCNNNFMTVKDVADATGVDERTIQREVAKFFPDTVKNGVKTLLTEEQVACISKDLKGDYHVAQTSSHGVEVPTTDLEIMANYKAANDAYTGLLERKNSELKDQNKQLESTCKLLADQCVAQKTQIDEMHNLVMSPSFSAGDIGKTLGVTPNRIGRIAKKYGIKVVPDFGKWVDFTSPNGKHTGKNFSYNDRGVQRIKECLAKEILE